MICRAFAIIVGLLRAIVKVSFGGPSDTLKYRVRAAAGSKAEIATNAKVDRIAQGTFDITGPH